MNAGEGRYARQEQVIGAAAQAALARAHVLVIGAGGLAAPALPLLVGAGIGRLTLLDADHVEITNLHRQTLFTEADLGRPKAEAAAAALRARNSRTSITAQIARLTPETAPDLVAEADLVLDCADNFAVSYTLSDACHAAQTPLLTGSALARAGYVAGVCGGVAPSLRALFPVPPETSESCASGGIIGPVVALIGTLQAQMALTLLSGDPAPLGQMIRFDGARGQFAQFRFDAAPEPERRFAFLAPSQLRADDLLIDLRRASGEITPPAPGRRLALQCATGLRAWRAAEEIAAKWPGEIVLVAAATS